MGVGGGAHHSLGVDPQVDASLPGPLQDVFGCQAAVNLQGVEEHVAVQPVAGSLQTWSIFSQLTMGHYSPSSV